MAENPLTVPSPAVRPDAPSGTQASPVVTTPHRRAVESGMRQEGVINKMREAQLERAKAAGRTAQQHVNMMAAAQQAAVNSALSAPEVALANPPKTVVAGRTVVAETPIMADPRANNAQAPAVHVEPQPTPAAVAPAVTSESQPLASTPVAEPPKPVFANKALEVSWNTIRESESRLAAERAKFAAEKAAIEAQKNAPVPQAAELEQLRNGLKSDPVGVLAGMGYTPEQIAQAVLTRFSPAGGQQRGPVAPPAFSPAAVPPPPPQSNHEVVELRRALEETQGAFVNFVYGQTLATPDFSVLATVPDAIPRALAANQAHFAATGNYLPPQVACARAQEELVAAKKAEYAALTANPAWSKAIGYVAPTPSVAPPVSDPPPVVPSAPQEITTISSDLASGGALPPVTMARNQQWLSPEEARREKMLERARAAGEATRSAALPR